MWEHLITFILGLATAIMVEEYRFRRERKTTAEKDDRTLLAELRALYDKVRHLGGEVNRIRVDQGTMRNAATTVTIRPEPDAYSNNAITDREKILLASLDYDSGSGLPNALQSFFNLSGRKEIYLKYDPEKHNPADPATRAFWDDSRELEEYVTEVAIALENEMHRVRAGGN